MRCFSFLLLCALFCNCKSDFQSKAKDKVVYLSKDSLYKTEKDINLFNSFKAKFLSSYNDTLNCYMSDYFPSKKCKKCPYKTMLKLNIENIFWTENLDTVCFLVSINDKWNDKGDLVSSPDPRIFTKVILMNVIVDKFSKWSFVCGNSLNYWLSAEGDQNDYLSEEYKELIIEWGYFKTNTFEQDPHFFKRLFNGG